MRTIIFLSCFLLFTLIAPSVVLYSQGYRIDLENRKISQTGGLFIEALPKQVDIYLSGKANERTDFFFGSVLIQNLLPKKYEVEIKKEGYHSWGKTLEIKEKEVKKIKNVILFPQNINFNVLADETERFWFSPDQKKIILQEGEKKLGWALKLYDLDRNIKSHLLNETDIFARGAELINLTFSEDSKRIYLQTTAKEQMQYFTLSLDKIPAILTETTPPNRIVSQNKSEEGKPSSSPLAGAREDEALIVIAAARVGNDVYHLDELGRLFKNGAELTSQPFPLKQETEYLLNVFQDYIFLQEVSGSLYIFNPDLKSFEVFFDGIKSLKISPDNEKLAYFSDHEIWILPLGEEAKASSSSELQREAKMKKRTEFSSATVAIARENDKNNSFQQKTDEKIFLIRLSGKINDVFWINNDYLIFVAGDKIKISEIDNRERLNIIDIFEIKKLPQEEGLIKMFWNQSDKRIYLLSGKTLYQSSALLP